MNLQLPAFLLFETHFANFSSEMLSGVYAGVFFFRIESIGFLMGFEHLHD